MWPRSFAKLSFLPTTLLRFSRLLKVPIYRKKSWESLSNLRHATDFEEFKMLLWHVYLNCFGKAIRPQIRSKLLKEAQLNAQHRNQNFSGVSSKMNLIFLGKQFSGKSALITRLRNGPLVGEKNSAAAFEYNYIDLKYAEGESRLILAICAMCVSWVMQRGQVRACVYTEKLVQINQNACKIRSTSSMQKNKAYDARILDFWP